MGQLIVGPWTQPSLSVQIERLTARVRLLRKAYEAEREREWKRSKLSLDNEGVLLLTYRKDEGADQ